MNKDNLPTDKSSVSIDAEFLKEFEDHVIGRE
jgi:hypothetical protein